MKYYEIYLIVETTVMIKFIQFSLFQFYSFFKFDSNENKKKTENIVFYWFWMKRMSMLLFFSKLYHWKMYE